MVRSKGRVSGIILFAPGVRRFRTLSSSAKGFTLLEVLVAVALLGIAITVVLQLFSADLKAIAASEEYVSATARAEAKMREVQDNDTLSEGTTSEMTNDGYRLDVSVASTLQERTDTLQVMLMDILVTVHWTKGT
ncbi:MAG TPA: type II secretion system protein, partial [Thermodesulfovibrionales bacterium]|nr:type II secretion system protein [Thermodesulfovibrionales bacterium]